MDEMKNVLKEIDLQVVYKRLEERKKNITNDGKMSKRQLAAAYRGWYGVEARYNALMHMSDEQMMKTENRNQHLAQKHGQEMKQMLEHEKYVKEESKRAIKALRDDFTSMLAYQYAYKTNTLKNIEKANEKINSAQRKRPHSDRYDSYDKERSASSMGPRPLGSLREQEKYRNELKIKFPSVQNKIESQENADKPQVNMLGEKHFDTRTISRNSSEKVNATAFPNIEHAMGVEIKFRKKISTENDKESFFSAPPDITRETDSDDRVQSRTSVTEFDMGQNLILMRRKEQEKFEKRRILPPTPNPQTKPEPKIERHCKHRKLPAVPQRCAKLYPAGTKNANGMHKFIRREATEVLESWSQDPKRLEIYEKGMKLEKPDPLLHRPQTTSEMFRELKQYKTQEKHFREQQIDEQAMIVRQLTPLPRPLSPISTRMTEYSNRISSPLPRKEKVPSFKPKREGSEKIPSVSRTSSYKELPDGPIELHENALLTAAERIEKERLQKLKRNKEKTLKMAKIAVMDAESDRKDNENNIMLRRELPGVKTKRVLPQPVLGSKASTLNINKDQKVGQNSILRQNSDLESIDTVSKANTIKDGVLKDYEWILAGKPSMEPTSTLFGNLEQPNKQYWKLSESLDPQKESFQLERDAYTPISRKTEPIKRRLTPISDLADYTPLSRNTEPIKGRVTPISDIAATDQFRHFSSFSGKQVLGKLEKKLHFSYDNFSRVPPDTKKRLELRAKNKRKAQLHNAKLEEEKEKGSLANERPPTRVSFNEKVVVFQTI